MLGRWNLLILALHLSLPVVLSCPLGYTPENNTCIDVDECVDDHGNPGSWPCGKYSKCLNTHGSFHCKCFDGFQLISSTTCRDINECLKQKDICGLNAKCRNKIPHYSCTCMDGFISTTGNKTFGHSENATCEDINECQASKVCDQNATCTNTLGSYQCVCNPGFGLTSGKSYYTGNQSQCEDICIVDKTVCGNGTCHRGADGHYCACHAGFTNYGNNASRCTALNCDVFKDTSYLRQTFPSAHDLVEQLKKSCLDPTELDGEDLLKRLLSVIDRLLSGEAFRDNRKVSTFLDLMENTLKLIGPFIKPPGTNRSSNHTELQLLVHKGADLPQGAVALSSMQAQLDMQLETAAGDPSSYPGFTAVSLLSYANLEDSAEGFYSGMKPKRKERFKINSKVVTVSVSNTNTSHLQEPIKLTFNHLEKRKEFPHTCVFWSSSQEGGTWSARGCSVVESNPEYTVCSCNHLSSFAVLIGLYDIEGIFELQLISWVGLSLSLICLFICILTFSSIGSIHSPRNTIHLHLCISLFFGILILLTRIYHTENKVGCAVIAALLHFFFLAAFCWMCLEHIDLFKMVYLDFNTNFKTRYMMAGGYGVPAVIVAISASVNAKGYGTDRHCWLRQDIIWSFFGPACVIIIINIFFFLITVWKLAQKFSSLNPDLDNLQKIKVFTITSLAQLCVLSTMWSFGYFQFEEGTIVMAYLFTIFGSFQGVMLFVMHCLFSKQVREEYGNILSKCCSSRKKTYTTESSSFQLQQRLNVKEQP